MHFLVGVLVVWFVVLPLLGWLIAVLVDSIDTGRQTLRENSRCLVGHSFVGVVATALTGWVTLAVLITIVVVAITGWVEILRIVLS